MILATVEVRVLSNRIIEIVTFGNEETGYLSYLEANRNIPFEIKRVYYTYGVPRNLKRGMHAHKKLQQVLWCPHGIIEIVTDDGKRKNSYLLNSPDKALLIVNGCWREIYWKKEDSILCVVASDYYDENDYIRDYDEYIRNVRERD